MEKEAFANSFYIPKNDTSQNIMPVIITLREITKKKKIGYTSARIDLKISKSGKCFTTIYETHVGHKNKLCHVDISSSKRKEKKRNCRKITLCISKKIVLHL